MRPRIFFLFSLFLVLLPSVLALSVSPPKIEFPYSPGVPQYYAVTVGNGESTEEIVVVVSFQGEGSPYLSVVDPSDERFTLKSGEYRVVEFELNHPEMATFGTQRYALVKFYQVPFTNAQVGATVAMLVPLDTVVPYPAKYIVASLADPGVVLPGGTVTLRADVVSYGTSVIETVTGYFTVANELESYTLPIEDMQLVIPGDNMTVSASLDTTGFQSDRYDVTLTLTYDGETIVSSPKQLLVGSRDFAIDNISQTAFYPQLTSLSISLYNLWVDDLTVDLTLELIDSADALTASTSVGVYTLPPASVKEIWSTIDLSHVAPGEYWLRVIGTMDDGTLKRKDFKVVVLSQPSEEVASSPGVGMTPLLVVGILTVVLLLVTISILLLIWRKNGRVE